MSLEKNWRTANRALIAKALGELSYEQLLRPVAANEGAAPADYAVKLDSGVVYSFHAWRSVWDHLRVRPDSVTREADATAAPAESAAQFFIDARENLGMSEITLGVFLEEMHSTLAADVRLLEKTADLSADEIADWDGQRVQSVLNGHPKILLNKGRMGWGASDLENYAPESGKKFRLEWIAVRSSRLETSLGAASDPRALSRGDLAPEEIAAFEKKIADAGEEPSSYTFVPAHPWQWDRVLRVQFLGEIANRDWIPLGPGGDFFEPQISLRTLSNRTRPESPDIKLPLTILNTSAVRGIPARYIHCAPRIADAIADLCRQDPVLSARGADVLKDLAGASFRHSAFEQVKGAPYRYHETVGALWRESVPSKLKGGEIGVMTGALLHQDREGNSLLGAYIRKSGLSIEKWLTRYFDAVVVPLYHLQVRYGLGLVAHGQNVVVRLRDFAPAGVLLKDFQGDLRVSSETAASPELAGFAGFLDRLPPDYLIHDLLTGHFLTVLRFVSEVLQESEGFPEPEFYRLLADSIRAYLNEQGLDRIDPRLDLLGGKIARVLLNKVRFQIGYADSSERPLPLLGTDLANPLCRGGLS